MRKNNRSETGQVTHQAYLLHLWREPQDHIWRASMKTTAGEKEIAFASLDELFVYLLRQTEEHRREHSLGSCSLPEDTTNSVKHE